MPSNISVPGAVAIAILVVMTALVIAAVAARYVFQAPLVYS